VQTLIAFCGQGRFQQAVANATALVQQFPDSFIVHYLLGAANAGLGRFDAAIASYRHAIKIKSDYAEVYNHLAIALANQGDQGAAIAAFRQALKVDPRNADGHYNLGNALKAKGDLDAAIDSYRRAVKFRPDHVAAWTNMGNAQKAKGDLDAAIDSYRQALRIRPDLAEAYNNIGNVLYDQGELQAAIDSYEQAVKVKPGYTEAFWNLSGTARGIEEAGKWIDQCLAADPAHVQARITRAALGFYRGDRSGFDELLRSELKDHPYVRSCSWVFSLPRLPELYFNRWALFDAVVRSSIKERPFYEFGVWRGYAFRYLIKTFKKGYGFDTFSGLPEDWHGEQAGAYSSDGKPPSIEGGEFIVGKFEESLPVFFSTTRPMASVINFDADLYSSTLCALNHSKPVIDRHTILIFDELIINQHWEQDEFKALNEFCAANNCAYEVVAVSFYTKQVAVRLTGTDVLPGHRAPATPAAPDAGRFA
jgi:tetratricopeptide (TPR) repeat protein